MRQVEVSGLSITGESGEEFIEVVSIQVLIEEQDEVKTGAGHPFGKTIPLEELARTQGVKPVKDLDELFSTWPEDDDPDELFRFIMKQREERRSQDRARDSKP